MSGRVISKVIPTQVLKDLLESHYRALSIIDDGEEVQSLELEDIVHKMTSITIKLRSKYLKDETVILSESTNEEKP